MNINDYWNGWRVAEYLGEGTFGTVYRIEKKEYGQVYNSALKVVRIPRSQAEVKNIQNEGLDEKSMTMYFNSVVENIVSELAMMSKLRGNSNIVSYEDHKVVKLEDSFGWDIYIKMELLTPLYDYIRDNTLTVEDVVNIGIDICKALELCSKYNIIHRDIKPENIFHSEHGDYKLGDFGIARELEKTMAGLSKTGTPAYMAPEVYKGLRCNATVDTYSLGIVLYRLLNNNRTPFLPDYPKEIVYEDRQTANIKRLSGEDIPMPCNADTQLSDIILKACAYDPKDRYDSAEEMRKALEEYDCSENDENVLLPLNEKKQDVSIETASAGIEATAETLNLEEHDANGEESADAEMEPKSRPEKHFFVLLGNHKKLTITTIVLLLFALSFGGYKFFHHTVPKVVGLHNDAAELAVKHAGLKYNEEERVFSNSVARGVVISQSINPGQQIRHGSFINVVVSKGKPIKLPNIVGKKEATATSILEEKHLVLKVKSSEYSDTVEKGRIISQDPVPGKECEEDQIIRVIVSKGVELVKVPDVVGMTQEKAEETLSIAGFKTEIETVYSSSSSGVVIDQSEDAGEKAAKNSLIIISVSSKQSSYKNTPSKRKRKSGGSNNTGNYYNEDELQSDSSDDSEGSGYEEVQNQPSVDTDNSSTPSEGGSETHDNQSNVNGDTEE